MNNERSRSTPLKRVPSISLIAETTVDIRKACNGIKRMSALGAAALSAGLDPQRAVAAAENMALEILDRIGFDIKDEARLATVLPMMVEATSLVIADAAKNAALYRLSPEELVEASAKGVGVLVEVAKSRVVSKMVEPAYPHDIEATVAIRVTTASALAVVAVEIAEFDFAHSPASCIKESGKIVVEAALKAATEIAPPHTSSASRLMLTQSLIQSASKILAAAWRACCLEEIAKLDALETDAQRDDVLDQMASRHLSENIKPIKLRFDAAFSAIIDCATELFPSCQATDSRPARATSTSVGTSLRR